MNNTTILATIFVSAIITILIRFLPFLIFKGKETPSSIRYLGDVLPYAIMAMLVVYCLKGIDFTTSPFGAREIITTLATVLLHVWKRNTLISVVGGTAIYMVLVNLL